MAAKLVASIRSGRVSDTATLDSEQFSDDGAQLKAVLENCSFYHDLEPSAQQKLPQIGRVVKKRCGTILFQKGELHEQCYIILAGKVEVSSADVPKPASVKEDAASLCSTAASSQSPSRCSSRRGRNDYHANVDILNNVAKTLAHAVAKKQEGKLDRDGVHSVSAHSLSLGASRLFGDLALLQQGPQGFSASCKEDCELFVIEKRDFEKVLKEDLQRLTYEKLDLLKKYLPGMHTISPQMAEPLLQCFQKKQFSKGHVICSQNAAAKKSVYVVSKGSVFLSCTNASMQVMAPDLRRMGSLFKGGVFGCMEDTPIQPFTVSCTSSCELFVASGRYLQALPPSVRRSTQNYLCQTTEWSQGDACGSPHRSSGDHKNEEEHMSRRPSEPLMKSSPSLSGLLAQRAHGQLNQATGAHKRGLEPMNNFPTVASWRSSEPQMKRSVSSSAMPSRKAQAQVSPDSNNLMMRALKRKSSLPSLSRTI